MPLYTIFQIASQGMTAQRQRLEAASANLANANSTRAADGKPYQRRDVVFTAIDINDQWRRSSGDLAGSGLKPQGVSSEVVIGDENAQVVHQPGHPDADENGYVRLPDVSSGSKPSALTRSSCSTMYDFPL